MLEFIRDNASGYDKHILSSLEYLQGHENFPEANLPNYLLLTLKIKPEHCNYIKTIHGGAVGTLIDISTSMVLFLNDLKK